MNIPPSKKKFNSKKLRESYNRIYRKNPIKESEEHYRWIIDVLEIKKGDRIMDVACGGGYLLKVAKNRGLDCIGIDISIEALRIVKQQPTKTKVICGDAEALPFQGESFEVITNLGSLEHFINPSKGLHEMHRVLKTGGRAAFCSPTVILY